MGFQPDEWGKDHGQVSGHVADSCSIGSGDCGLGSVDAVDAYHSGSVRRRLCLLF